MHSRHTFDQGPVSHSGQSAMLQRELVTGFASAHWASSTCFRSPLGVCFRHSTLLYMDPSPQVRLQEPHSKACHLCKRHVKCNIRYFLTLYNRHVVTFAFLHFPVLSPTLLRKCHLIIFFLCN